MKKLATLLVVLAIMSFLIYKNNRGSVYKNYEEVITAERNLTGCLTSTSTSILNKIEKTEKLQYQERFLTNLDFVSKFKGHILDFQLIDKVYEIDSVLYHQYSENVNTKIEGIGQSCNTEIKIYNSTLQRHNSSSIWFRNSMEKKGEILKNTFFEYSNYSSKNQRPSVARALKNAELDSILLEGLRKVD